LENVVRHLLLIALITAFPEAAFGVSVTQLHVLIPMRDGVHLSANIFRPGGTAAVSTILIRTPYGKGVEATANYQAFVDHGYAVVVQDVRGRHDSEGTFAPLVQETGDGEDTVNWVARQPWSDGKVGMTGGSYLGICQWKVAVLNNPHLKAIFPWVSGDDDYRDRFYSTGGAMKLGHRLMWIEGNLRDPDYVAPDFKKYIWTLPLRRTDIEVMGKRSRLMQEVFNHPDYDAFWQGVSVNKQLKGMKVPVFSVGGWYDNYVESDLDAYATLRKTSNVNRIMIGPWPHNPGTPFKDVDFGPQANVGFRKFQLAWFDQWMHGKNDLGTQPPVRIFVMGVNQWRDEYEWPIARARAVKFYLESGGHANGLDGDGALSEDGPKNAESPDSFVYDPRNPVPTRGGAVCCNPEILPWGPLDQRVVEKRHDVLVYSTPPLTEDVEVTGPVQVFLSAASSALDTDFTAKLVDVFPNGVARILCDGLLRARYRNSLSKQELLKPGEIYKVKIDAGVTSNVFRKGHSIRVEISSSNFPRFDRNQNTGRAIADEVELKAATQTIHHDRKHASYVLLPVVPMGSHAGETLTRTAVRVPVKQGLKPVHD
jgi:putative CocE/NonD family hydrolase